MSRLIAFGCSYTFGQGLEDIHSKFPYTKSSKLAWPNLLANKLNLKCINNAEPGNTNFNIWHAALKYKFKKDDIVFILWTHKNRHTIFETSYRYDNLTKDDAKTKCFYDNFYSPYQSNIQTALYISHLNYEIPNKIINLFLDKNEFDTAAMFKNITTIDASLLEYYNRYPKALDNSHPGQLAHKEYAEKIYTCLTY
jgi:hypothetical protein